MRGTAIFVGAGVLVEEIDVAGDDGIEVQPQEKEGN
jgi:hypothetical protein